MPTTSLSINGVPYTDTYKFLEEFKSVVARDADNIETLLLEWAELEEAGADEYENIPMWEVVRNPDIYFCCKNRCDSGGHAVRYRKHISKPKEVK
jgi:hypothetical protein